MVWMQGSGHVPLKDERFVPQRDAQKLPGKRRECSLQPIAEEVTDGAVACISELGGVLFSEEVSGLATSGGSDDLTAPARL